MPNLNDLINSGAHTTIAAGGPGSGRHAGPEAKKSISVAKKFGFIKSPTPTGLYTTEMQHGTKAGHTVSINHPTGGWEHSKLGKDGSNHEIGFGKDANSLNNHLSGLYRKS